MKNKNVIIQGLVWTLLLLVAATSCSRLKKAKDIVTNPSAKELYSREFKEAGDLYSLWEDQATNALLDSITVNLPYAERGIFSPRTFPVYSYEMTLNPGERLKVEVETDTVETLVFIDFFRQQNDSLKTFKHEKSAKYAASALAEEITQPGTYKILIQPEIKAHTPFQLQMYREPVYEFPVASIDSKSVQSFWGAIRDGGRRSHEGIDIFAPRGTPVVAAVKGRVTRTGNRGLGGKQVWLRDRERGNSLYYAHLDSIIATPGMTVVPGDTLGLVGNTGNAITTPPHLHFGIYTGYRGAVNPFFYVSEALKPEIPDVPTEDLSNYLIVTGARANLRSGPSTKFPVLGQSESQDTLRLLGKSNQWYHIMADDRKSFIHESLVSPI